MIRTLKKTAQIIAVYGGTLALCALAFFALWGRKLNFADGICLFLGLILAFASDIIIHELGHMAFSLIGGMKCRSVSFLGIKFVKVMGKVRIRRMRGSVFGACECYPVTRNVRRAFLFMAIGGPAGSLLCLLISGLFLALYAVLPTWAFALLGFPCFVHYLLFAENAWPSISAGMRTDGSQIVGAIKKTPSISALLKVLEMQAGYYFGNSPSELAWKELYELPQLMEFDPNYLYVLNARYLYALDAGNKEALKDAHMRISAIYELIPEALAGGILADLFYDSLILFPDPDFAKKHEIQAIAYLMEYYDVTSARILAAYYLAKGDAANVFREVSSGREIAGDHIFSGIAKMELRLLAEIEAQAAKL